MIYNRFGSVQAISRILEAPISKFGAFWWFGSGNFFAWSHDKEEIWADNCSFFVFKSSTDFTNMVLLSSILSILSCNCSTKSLKTLTVVGRDRHGGHSHQDVSVRMVSSFIHCSWCQRKHMQQRIISPVSDRWKRQFSIQWLPRVSAGDVLPAASP